MDYDDYVGRIAIGKIMRGQIKVKTPYTQIDRQGDMQVFTPSKLYCYEGLKKVESKSAVTGDIIGIAGMKEVEIGEKIGRASCRERVKLSVVAVSLKKKAKPGNVAVVKQ